MALTRPLSPFVLACTVLSPLACSNGSEESSDFSGGSGQVTTVGSVTMPAATTGATVEPTDGGASESVSASTSDGPTQGTEGADSTSTGPLLTSDPDTTDPTQVTATSTTDPTNDPTNDATTEDSCAEVKVDAENIKTPADIIFVIDNSGSMGFEEGEVQKNMNKFSNQIIASGIDVHVVLISNYNICIDAPLGSGGCPNLDTKLPQFLHVDHGVSSNNALQLLLDLKPQWEASMRPDALKHVIVVSDDNSDLSAGSFHASFQALGPEYTNYKFHAIVGLLDPNSFLECAQDPTCCLLIAEDGSQYISLAGLTGGVVGPLCDNGKQDFTGLFNTLSTEVVSGAKIECEWLIPEPMGQDIDFNKVNVDYNDGVSPPQAIPKVDGMAACGALEAWYYDDPGNPTKIYACPTLCAKIQGNVMASVDVKFGCETLVPQ